MCVCMCVCVCNAIHSFIDSMWSIHEREKKNKDKPRGQACLEVSNKFTKSARGQSKTKILKKLQKEMKKNKKKYHVG